MEKLKDMLLATNLEDSVDLGFIIYARLIDGAFSVESEAVEIERDQKPPAGFEEFAEVDWAWSLSESLDDEPERMVQYMNDLLGMN